MDKYAIFHIEGGCGKNIVATSVCKSIKAAYPEHKLIVTTAYPEVFIHNPFIYRVYKFGYLPYFYEDYIHNKDSKIFRTEPYHSEDFLYRRKSLAEIWCNILNVPFISEKPDLFITERELIHVVQKYQINHNEPTLLIQSSGGVDSQNSFYSWSRDLPPRFAQELVNSLKDKFSKILHIRKENQPVLENTISVTDGYRNLFSLIAYSSKIIAIDSFVQHAAAAFTKKSTVGWISTSPTVFGYKIHNNILASEQQGEKHFRHKIDSYLESDDWSGIRHYECPYNNLDKIFNKDDFINSIIKS